MILVMYAIMAVLHLVGCLAKSGELADRTKPLLMPLLGLTAFLSGGEINPLVYVALGLCFLGDIFMINEGSEKLVILGIASFGLAHILYTIVILRTATLPNLLVILLVILPFLFYSLFIYKKLNPSLPGEMRLPVIFYLIVIVAMSIAALINFITQQNIDAGLIFAGSLFFIISDTVLAFRIFKKDERYSSFMVMVTYIGAQSLLIAGFVLAGKIVQ